MAERGSLDLLGPSTKRAVAAVLAGTPPDEAGAAGDTNGAAMRIAPVGIAVALPAASASHADLSTLVDHVVMASSVTHNTGIALAGAAAVAAAVSAGVSGAGSPRPRRWPSRPRGSRSAAATGWRARTSRPH